MIPSLTDLGRSRLAPVAALVAAAALLAVALAGGEEGSEVETLSPPAVQEPSAQDGAVGSQDLADLTAGPATDATGTVAPPTVPPIPGGIEAMSTTTESTAPAPVAHPPAPISCPDPWADLAGCGWPGPGNTGPRSDRCPGGLTANNSGSTTGRVTITEDNAVVSCQRITGALVIQGSNVTVRDSVVTFDGGGGNGGGAVVVDDGASATIERVEMDGLNNTHSCVWYQGESATISGINCHGVTDGVVAWARTSYSPTSGNNFTLRDSYFHDFTPAASNGHMDGFQTQGAENGEITHNTFLMPIEANAAVAIFNDVKSARNILVSGNLMAGAQFTVYAMDYDSGGNTVTDVTFRDNLFSTRVNGCIGQWGPWFVDTARAYQGGPTDGWNRSGNRILESGANIDGGNHDCR